MDLFCTAKTATKVGDNIECSVFMMRNRKLDPGSKLEQRRDESKIAIWELVDQTSKTLILKLTDGVSMFGPDGEINIEMADTFYIEPLIVEAPIMENSEQNVVAVLVFGGKNWKLASPKKWVKANLSLEGQAEVGELVINGKDHIIYKLTEGFAAKEKAAP